MILNTTTNYYIDSFEKYSASAIAAGAVFRSVVGGIVPLFAPGMLEDLGYGWGISVFGCESLECYEIRNGSNANVMASHVTRDVAVSNHLLLRRSVAEGEVSNRFILSLFRLIAFEC